MRPLLPSFIASLLTAALAPLAAPAAEDDPFATREPLAQETIEGVVSAYAWMSEMTHEEAGVRGVQGSSTTAPRYILKIVSPHLSPEVSAQLVEYAREAVIRHVILDAKLGADETLVIVASPRLKEMAVGARISVKGYLIRENPLRVEGVCESITLNGSPPTPLPPPDPFPSSAAPGE